MFPLSFIFSLLGSRPLLLTRRREGQPVLLSDDTDYGHQDSGYISKMQNDFKSSLKPISNHFKGFKLLLKSFCILLMLVTLFWNVHVNRLWRSDGLGLHRLHGRLLDTMRTLRSWSLR
jgi:hypothetical protein